MIFMPPGDRLASGSRPKHGTSVVITVGALSVSTCTAVLDATNSRVTLPSPFTWQAQRGLEADDSEVGILSSDNKAVFERHFICGGLATLNALRAHHASHRQPSEFGTDRSSIFTCPSSWRTSRTSEHYFSAGQPEHQPYLQIATTLDVALRHHAGSHPEQLHVPDLTI